MLRLSSDGDICASVSHDATAAPTVPIAAGKPPSTAPLSPSLSFSFSVSLSPRSLSPRQLGHPGLQERDSPWWNRGRQLFLQPQGHYLKSDRDSSEWMWERWGRREGTMRVKKKEGRGGGWLGCAGVLSSGGRGCWETNESSRHLVHTGDCLSIQIAVFRPAWERAENFLRELITWQLSCLVQFTKGRGLIRAGFLFLSEEGALALHPLFQLWPLSLCLSISVALPSSLPPQPLTSTPSELWKWLKWQPIERG